MMKLSSEVEAGQAVYSNLVLAIYDFYVLGVSNHLIWKCPTQWLLDNYNENISSKHLDVGVGTGYLLDKCQFPVSEPEVSLLDLNQNSLDVTAKRISRHNPVSYRHNVFDPMPFDGPQFDSIGMNYLLHCLPGTMESKSVVFDNLLEVLNPGGVIFGSTLVADEERQGWAARKLMAIYNRKGIFSNREDSTEALEKVLSERFSEYSLDRVGCAAIFSAVK